MENSTSRPLLINAGCPQGSVLGPLFALIYLNDLAGKTHNYSLFYADNTSLYTSYSRQSSCSSPPQQATHQQDFNTACKSLQNDLDIISEFGTNWHINFSADKTKQMTFTHASTSHSPVMSFINPRTAGGGGYQPPLRFFADSEKTAARSAAKFAIAIQPTI